MAALLDDPAYEPVHRPVGGRPNPVVAKWGARSQVRWFARFWGSEEMPTLRPSDAADFYCSSTEHKGFCCETCLDDVEQGYDNIDGHCCCRGLW